MVQNKPRYCIFCVYRRRSSRLLGLGHFLYCLLANRLDQASSLCPGPSHGYKPLLSKGEEVKVRTEIWLAGYNPIRPNIAQQPS